MKCSLMRLVLETTILGESHSLYYGDNTELSKVEKFEPEKYEKRRHEVNELGIGRSMSDVVKPVVCWETVSSKEIRCLHSAK